MKINDVFWGALFSSWIQSLVLEYKRKKNAFVLVEFNFPQMSDSPAHKTAVLCKWKVNSEGQSSKYLPVFVLCGGRFCTIRENGSCTQIEISPACQCSVIVWQAEENKEKRWALNTMLWQVTVWCHHQEIWHASIQAQEVLWGHRWGPGHEGWLLSHLAHAIVRILAALRESVLRMSQK